ncbi:MAG TPA: CoA-acylating methylmalonate-semialdehyde dehydrogenase [Candidatus Binataceae bacterium]|nr:CoA-acylating methylmalonate-semialdehyde dehydrogenase [Candidatus Binataceae bacterium]
MDSKAELLNYVDGGWRPSANRRLLDVLNPATAEPLASLPLSSTGDVDSAASAATKAAADWRRTPAVERVQFLFKLKALLEEHLDELARCVTDECGKTYSESAGEVRRGIDNVDVACGIPSLMQGLYSEDIARGIDEILIRQPLGVVAAITPFNFPAMIPLWFLPYAIACGNTFILKPSEKTPITAQRIFALVEKTGIPKGVVNLVNGDKESVDALLDHPSVKAISFVGSTTVARYVYSRATANGKRAQCQGGAKNPLIVLPDADIDEAVKVAAESAFGCAGQRCLAASTVIAVGAASKPVSEGLVRAGQARRVGYGLDEGVEMGPVISVESKSRILSLIDRGVEGGASLLLDGRKTRVQGFEHGYFIGPTVLDDVSPGNEIARTEIFGPVLGLSHAGNVEEAIEIVNRNNYGNMACLFTRSGDAARKFRYAARAGNIGINVGVAAPMAFFPFCGWNDSFFGDLHGQGRDAVAFYTDSKVVVERWPAS